MFECGIIITLKPLLDSPVVKHFQLMATRMHKSAHRTRHRCPIQIHRNVTVITTAKFEDSFIALMGKQRRRAEHSGGGVFCSVDGRGHIRKPQRESDHEEIGTYAQKSKASAHRGESHRSRSLPSSLLFRFFTVAEHDQQRRGHQ